MSHSKPKSVSAKPFARPELTSRWHKVSHNLVARITVGVVLIGGTAALVIIAVAH